MSANNHDKVTAVIKVPVGPIVYDLQLLSPICSCCRRDVW